MLNEAKRKTWHERRYGVIFLSNPLRDRDRYDWLAGRGAKVNTWGHRFIQTFFFPDLLQLNVSSDGTCPELASLLPQGYLLLLAGKPRPFRAHWLWCLKELYSWYLVANAEELWSFDVNHQGFTSLISLCVSSLIPFDAKARRDLSSDASLQVKGAPEPSTLAS